MTATTTPGLPVVTFHAASTLSDYFTSPAGARRYHCPTAGPPVVPVRRAVEYSGSLGAISG
jgi:hypothetical protein